MTISTNTDTTTDNSDVETVSDEKIARPIEELLKLDSFQGMTDEEIELIVQFREERALYNAQNLAKISAIVEEGTASTEAYKSIADAAHTNLEKLMNMTLDLVKVKDENE